MELIYFISGILTVGIVYGVNLLRHIKSSHTELLAKYQSQSNISSIRSSEMDEKIRDMEVYVGDFQTKLEKDSYKATTRLSKDMEKQFQIVGKLDSKVVNNINTTEKSLEKAFTEIQTMKNQIRALGEDPNFISRY